MCRWKSWPLLAALSLAACDGSPPEPAPEMPPPETPEPPRPSVSLGVQNGTWTLDYPDRKLTFEVAVSGHYGTEPETRLPVLDWTPDASGWISQPAVAGVPWTVRVELGAGDFRIEATTHALDTEVRREQLHVVFHDTRLSYLQRDYQWGSSAPAFVDPWTPQRLRLQHGTTELSAIGHSLGLRLPEAPGTVTLDLFHAESHPLQMQTQCSAEYTAESQRAVRAVAPRPTGPRRASLTLPISGEPVLEWLRFPERFRAAVAFTDHADQSSRARMNAILLGRSRPASPPTGFAGNGLSMSKSVFVRKVPGYAAQGSSEAYREALAAIQAVTPQDLGLHSVSGAADDRDTTAAGLATARQILGEQQRSFWIDHQPVTNCEALTNEGGGTQPHARPRYRIADLLAENGYAYAWAGTDAEEPADGINLFDPTRPDRNPPIAFAHHATGELLVFASLWRSCSVSCFLRFYRPELLDVLTEARGLHVAHTYLEMDSQREAFRDNTLFDKTSGGLVLKPEVEALFSDFRERQERGAIWFAGITPILDHLRAMQQLEIRVIAPGRLQIHNPSGRLRGASFRLRTPPSGIRVDGRALPAETIELEGEHAIFELDLEAGATRELSFPAGESIHYELVRAAE